jgi:hypothetical protein
LVTDRNDPCQFRASRLPTFFPDTREFTNTREFSCRRYWPEASLITNERATRKGHPFRSNRKRARESQFRGPKFVTIGTDVASYPQLVAVPPTKLRRRCELQLARQDLAPRTWGNELCGHFSRMRDGGFEPNRALIKIAHTVGGTSLCPPPESETAPPCGLFIANVTLVTNQPTAGQSWKTPAHKSIR